MKPDNSLPEGQITTPIPESFYSKILPEISNLVCLKILLYAFRINQFSENTFPVIDPEYLLNTFFKRDQQSFKEGMGEAITKGFLLQVSMDIDGQEKAICFINDARGRAAIDAIKQGDFRLDQLKLDIVPIQITPNIFKVYEQNIGVITPIVADSLKDLEETYSAEWIQDAIETAVKNNARSLRYIEVVLKKWQEEGNHVGTNQGRRRKTQEEYDPEGYTDGEFSDFIDS
jgi:DnaD/phage-associated family protein